MLLQQVVCQKEMKQVNTCPPNIKVDPLYLSGSDSASASGFVALARGDSGSGSSCDIGSANKAIVEVLSVRAKKQACLFGFRIAPLIFLKIIPKRNRIIILAFCWNKQKFQQPFTLIVIFNIVMLQRLRDLRKYEYYVNALWNIIFHFQQLAFAIKFISINRNLLKVQMEVLIFKLTKHIQLII